VDDCDTVLFRFEQIESGKRYVQLFFFVELGYHYSIFSDNGVMIEKLHGFLCKLLEIGRGDKNKIELSVNPGNFGDGFSRRLNNMILSGRKHRACLSWIAKGRLP